ncbi:MAG: cytochrome c [Chromatiales bacterium]|jgi:cytochrome c556
MKKLLTAMALSSCLCTSSLMAEGLTPEDAVEARQAGFTFMAWNMGRIKANLQGEYDAEEVKAAARAIASISNSGLGQLFIPGTEKSTAEFETEVKPELFDPENREQVGKLARDLAMASRELAIAAEKSDPAAVKTAFGATGKSCKACHDEFRMEDDD